jgi:hypothetical protein
VRTELTSLILRENNLFLAAKGQSRYKWKNAEYTGERVAGQVGDKANFCFVLKSQILCLNI